MKSVNCLLCNCESKSTITIQEFIDEYLVLINKDYNLRKRSIVACDNCGFVRHEPQLDSNDLEVLYERFRDKSFRSESPDAYFDRITTLNSNQSENFIKVNWIHNHAPQLIKRRGALLDIGCGGGVFIHEFLKLTEGWSAYGVEPTPSYADLAARRTNAKIFAGNHSAKLFGGKLFDLITINQVLEHVENPIDFLTKVRSSLIGHGKVYIEVPSIHDLEYLPPDHDRFMMQHLWIFSKNSLSSVCNRTGFKIDEIEQVTTIRNKRNIVALLSINFNSEPSDRELIGDNVSDIILMKNRYLASNTECE